MIDYEENSISPDSAKGIALLDEWFEFWCNVLRGIAQHTQFIQVELSGGFDTRMPLPILMNSGIDLSKIKLYSIQGEVHTYHEDYVIASQIAAHYGFKLNQPLPKTELLNYSLSDIYTMDIYHRQTFEKTPFSTYPARKKVDKLYILGGYAGETVRGNWLRFKSLETWYQGQINRSKTYSRTLSDKLARSMKTILDSGFSKVRNKYKIKDPKSLYILQYLYHDARCRHHFGKYTLGNYFLNSLMLSPALDPKIRTLRFDTPQCPDYQLLMALIFTRYEPDLLTFPFEGGRSIAPETIAYARKLSERFPRRKTTDKIDARKFHLSPRDMRTEQLLASGKNNPAIPDDLPKACLKAMFESSRTYSLFTAHFNAEIYVRAASYYDNTVFARFHQLYSIIGVARVLEDVEISQRNHPPYRDMQRFLEQDFAIIHDNDAQIMDKFKPYLTARVDVKLRAMGDFQILNVSDNQAKITKPAFLQNNGVGYKINSMVGKLEFVAKAAVDGQISLMLLGIWTNTLTRYWIDYTRFVVNGKTIFDTVTPAWNNKPYSYNLNVKAGEEVKVQVEWLPHRSDT